MIEKLDLRKRTMAFFALIALATPLIVGIGLWFAAQRIGDEAAVPHLVLFGGAASFALMGLVGWVAMKFDENVARPIQAISRELQTVVHGNRGHELETSSARYLGLLGPSVQEVADTLTKARGEVDQVVLEATSEMRAQKRRLESILNDLNEGVILCNRKHQVLLYNRRALQTLEISGDIGLGRSLFNVINKTPVLNTRERLTNRLISGRHHAHRDHLTAPLVVSTRDGRCILQGKMSLLIEEGTETEISGYVLTLSDATDHLIALAKGDRLVNDAVEELRGQLASARTAAEIISQSREMSPDDRTRFEQIVLGDVEAASHSLERLTEEYRAIATSHWPMSDVYSDNLISCLTRRFREDQSFTCDVTGEPHWLHCDSNTVIELLDLLISKIREKVGVEAFAIEARPSEKHVYLEVSWSGEVIGALCLDRWLNEPMQGGLAGLAGRDILEHHRSQVWCEPCETGRACLKLPLPLPVHPHQATLSGAPPIRLEFYDFSLLNLEEAGGDLRERKLRDLTYVVFDTETTGLEPSNGDEIVSIAGVRILNGRVLTGESFDELVDPGRSIPQRSTVVHGISNEMVAGKPKIDKVLARFRDYSSDAVLVAHNAAFDMKFLELKEKQTGIRIENPVLDTVLLSAIVHDHTDTHTLDAVAERFNVEIPPETRHTALGDSLATAGVFVHLIDLLEANGIHTLGQALDACDGIVNIKRRQAQY